MYRIGRVLAIYIIEYNVSNTQLYIHYKTALHAVNTLLWITIVQFLISNV